MQLVLFQGSPSASGRKRSRASAHRRPPLQHEVRASVPVVSDPELSFLRVLEGGAAPAAPSLPLLRPEASDGSPELDQAVSAVPHPTRGKTLAPEVFQDGEVRALLAACSSRAITGIRNRALLAVLWRTGVRISEALELLPCDVDFERGTVRVRLGKGLKSRTTVLNDLDCLPLLQDWLRLRQQLDEAGQGAPLFCTLRGGIVETSYVRHLMPRLARRAGIERRVHVHALRHTHAADLAIAGVPVLAIQQQLGHASLSTTSGYLKRVGVRLDMVGLVRRAAPERTIAPKPVNPSTPW